MTNDAHSMSSTSPDAEPDILTIRNPDTIEVLRIAADGRVYHLGREIETDDHFRTAMCDLREHLARSLRTAQASPMYPRYDANRPALERIRDAILRAKPQVTGVLVAQDLEDAVRDIHLMLAQPPT